MRREYCKGCEFLMTSSMDGIAFDYCKCPKHPMKLCYIRRCDRDNTVVVEYCKLCGSKKVVYDK